jgi:ubiquinone/menaquinone biosynthesis C-methylase UbiE
MADDSTHQARYVPAAGRAGLTRFYDPAMALTMRERSWRPALRDRVLAGVPAGGTVVEVGAGTGRSAIDLASRRPDVEVVAIDGDPEALALGQAKPGAERIHWQQGFAGQLTLPDASADAVVMSLLLHHLDPPTKRAALADARRILRPNGRIHIADWGRPNSPLTRPGFLILQLIDGFANTRDHAAGLIPTYLTDTGFTPTTWKTVQTAWGTLDLIEAVPTQ